MLRNMLAVVGLVVVAKAAYEHYREYRDLKAEKVKWDAFSRAMS